MYPFYRGLEYVDGGITENLALALGEKLTRGNIDCYFHNVKSKTGLRSPIQNILHLASRTFNIIREEISRDDLLSGTMQGLIENRNTISFSYLPSELTNNPLIFDKVKMEEWVLLGLSKTDM